MHNRANIPFAIAPEPPTLNADASNTQPDFNFPSPLHTGNPLGDSSRSSPQSPAPSPQPPSRPTGRPRRLDDVKRGQICAILAVGCGIETAAHYVGCSASTVRREIARDKKFDQEVRDAFLAAELKPLHALRQAAQTHWRAAAWFLERTLPRRFAKRDPRAVTPDVFREFIELLRDVMRKEIHDPELCQRILKRLTEVNESTMLAAMRAEVRPQLKPKKRGAREIDPPEFTERNDVPEEQDDDTSSA